MPTPLQRRSARAILLDRAGRVLLIRFAISRDRRTFVFWATPGGGVEVDETEREIKEELALDVVLTGPVHTAVDRFTHKGALVVNTDVFFVGRLDQDAPRLHAAYDDERVAMQLSRWWSSEEVEQAAETIFPRDLAEVIRRLA
jgi:ADP-ribose pyrophosphatase YjhB (NUDIX family)